MYPPACRGAAWAPALLALVLVMTFLPPRAGGHCQVPCGIYDDPARVDRLYEDAETIEKAMRAIAELAGKSDPQSANQLARWVATKEEHASNIMAIVGEYFLAQRVKPAGATAAPAHAAATTPASVDADRMGYLEKLENHHRVILAAMKTKQEIGLQHAAALREAIEGIAQYYLPPEQGHEHGGAR